MEAKAKEPARSLISIVNAPTVLEKNPAWKTQKDLRGRKGWRKARHQHLHKWVPHRSK